MNTETDALSYLTGLYFDDGKSELALATGREAIRRSQMPGVSGKSRSDAYLTLGYSLLLLKPGDPEGVRLLGEAARIASQAHLPAWDRANVLGDLAWGQSIRAQLPAAERNAAESISLYKSLPVQVCQIAMPVLAMARVYRVQKRFQAAERILRENYQRVAVCLGSGYDLALSVLGQWGYALVFTGRSQEAIDRLEAGLPLARKAYGQRNSNYIVDILAPLGLAYEAAGQPAKAEAVSRNALSILREDPENPDVAQAKRTLGRALYAQHKFTEALAYLEAADAGYAKHAPDSIYAQGLHAILLDDRRQIALAQKQLIR